jgi:hypothetical protein
MSVQIELTTDTVKLRAAIHDAYVRRNFFSDMLQAAARKEGVKERPGEIDVWHKLMRVETEYIDYLVGLFMAAYRGADTV